MKPFDYKSAKELGITEIEREGLIAVALMLPFVKHTPKPQALGLEIYPPYPKLKTFDMSHVRCGAAGCIKGWMAHLGYGDIDPCSHSEILDRLYYPSNKATKYADITPRIASTAVFHFLRTGLIEYVLD